MNSHHRRQVPFVLVLLILVGIASAASAQPAVDLTVSDIQVVFSANNWRVLPQITLVALESQATHPLQVRIYLDSDPIETLEGQMMYDPDPSSCYGAPWPTCGGDCPDIHVLASRSSRNSLLPFASEGFTGVYVVSQILFFALADTPFTVPEFHIVEDHQLAVFEIIRFDHRLAQVLIGDKQIVNQFHFATFY